VWKLSVENNVAAASGTDDDAVVTEYIRRAWSTERTAALAVVPPAYKSLDRKLQVAISTVTERERGDLFRLIINAQEAAQTRNQVLTGLTCLRIVHKSFRCSNETTMQVALNNLAGLPAGNDLRNFVECFRSALQGLPPSVTDEMALEPLIDKVETFAKFAPDLARFRDKKKRKRTLDALLTMIDKHLELELEKSNKQLMLKSYGVAQFKRGGHLGLPGQHAPPPKFPPTGPPPKHGVGGGGGGGGGGVGKVTVKVTVVRVQAARARLPQVPQRRPLLQQKIWLAMPLFPVTVSTQARPVSEKVAGSLMIPRLPREAMLLLPPRARQLQLPRAVVLSAEQLWPSASLLLRLGRRLPPCLATPGAWTLLPLRIFVASATSPLLLSWRLMALPSFSKRPRAAKKRTPRPSLMSSQASWRLDQSSSTIAHPSSPRGRGSVLVGSPRGAAIDVRFF